MGPRRGNDDLLKQDAWAIEFGDDGTVTLEGSGGQTATGIWRFERQRPEWIHLTISDMPGQDTPLEISSKAVLFGARYVYLQAADKGNGSLTLLRPLGAQTDPPRATSAAEVAGYWFASRFSADGTTLPLTLELGLQENGLAGVREAVGNGKSQAMVVRWSMDDAGTFGLIGPDYRLEGEFAVTATGASFTGNWHGGRLDG
jgi:hypothetical protein